MSEHTPYTVSDVQDAVWLLRALGYEVKEPRPCESCGHKTLELRDANEYGALCPTCYQKWFKGEAPFDEGDES
jgi:hypothetical protein